LQSEWWPALRDGLILAGAVLPDENDVAFAFYGNLFRPGGTMSLADPPYDATDVDGWEAELLEVWWREAARTDPQVTSPEAGTMLGTSSVVQRGLNALSNSRFFVGLAERAMIGALKQVHLYITDDAINAAVQACVSSVIQDDTRVVIGHSLGSIVAYEALCAHPEWPVKRFVTLGSPLGIRHLIFERLRPPPQNGVGACPVGIASWINIADAGDVVALVKALRPQFGGSVEDVLINNGWEAHDVKRYLTAEETGRAIAGGLEL
jgi:hypothetical protein